MLFSQLNEIPQKRNTLEVFSGYNHNIKIAEGEFFDMKNLTSSYYPVISPRGKRGAYVYPVQTEHKTNGMISKDSLCYVDGTHLYINDYKVEGLTLTDSKKQLISMGAYIIIMPDKKYINTKDLSDYGSIEASYISTAQVKFEMCNITGSVYEGASISDTAPSEPKSGDYWIDTSTTPHVLKQYSASSAMWTQVPTCYIKISAPGIGASFKQYDAVKISGISDSITQMADLEGKTSILYEVSHDGDGANDYVVVVGFLDQITTQDTSLTLERRMPKMDFIIESSNRLWGCRYGVNNDGKVVNEIYASKLGDFKNWNCFMGISSDSYAASCGTDGQFTGAIVHLGYPIFFKENCLHKVYGTFPSNYQIQTTPCRGVMKGAGDSLAIVNETLFYKSRSGVCSYDGSLPYEVSSALGSIRYTGTDGEDPYRNGAVAGANMNKYYISMKSEVDNKWYLFVFDTQYKLWHKEDNTRADMFCSYNGEMYYVDHEDGLIKTILGSGNQAEDDIEWMAESGVLGTSTNSGSNSYSMPGKKYVSNLTVRMSLAIGARVMFYIQYDSSGDWEHISTFVGTSLKSFSAPIRPKRCDHFKLRIVGRGDAKIYSITKSIEQGSDY